MTGVIYGKLHVSMASKYNDLPFYDGSYEVVPTLDTQEIATKNRILQGNIKIAPVPEEFSSKDSNTTDATAKASEILTGKSAYVNKQKITGSMPNNGAVQGEISNLSESYSVAEGYHNGEGSVRIKTNTLIPENIKSGVEVLGVQGTFTDDATAAAAEILENKSAYVNAEKFVGTMPNRGSVNGIISELNTPFQIPNGYHDGSGLISVEKSKIIPANIKSGVEILGVTGTFTDDATAAAEQILVGKTAYSKSQKITGTMPDNGAIEKIISDVDENYIIPAGYHNGSGQISIEIPKFYPSSQLCSECSYKNPEVKDLRIRS